jgi:hypothetical protein
MFNSDFLTYLDDEINNEHNPERDRTVSKQLKRVK